MGDPSKVLKLIESGEISRRLERVFVEPLDIVNVSGVLADLKLHPDLVDKLTPFFDKVAFEFDPADRFDQLNDISQAQLMTRLQNACLYLAWEVDQETDIKTFLKEHKGKPVKRARPELIQSEKPKRAFGDVPLKELIGTARNYEEDVTAKLVEGYESGLRELVELVGCEIDDQSIAGFVESTVEGNISDLTFADAFQSSDLKNESISFEEFLSALTAWKSAPQPIIPPVELKFTSGFIEAEMGFIEALDDIPGEPVSKTLSNQKPLTEAAQVLISSRKTEKPQVFTKSLEAPRKLIQTETSKESAILAPESPIFPSLNEEIQVVKEVNDIPDRALDTSLSVRSIIEETIRTYEALRIQQLENSEDTTAVDSILKACKGQLRSKRTHVSSQPVIRTEKWIAKCKQGVSDIFQFYAKQVSMIGKTPSFSDIERANQIWNLSKFLKFLKDFGLSEGAKEGWSLSRWRVVTSSCSKEEIVSLSPSEVVNELGILNPGLCS